MRKLGLITAVLMLSLSWFVSGFAEVTEPLNTVSFQMSEEQWVSIDTAEVTVVVSAALNQPDLAAASQKVIAQLGKIVPDAKWQIVKLDRSQDQSGLERLEISVQARLGQSQLTGLSAKVKSISSPGETYHVADVAFTPTLEAVEAARAAARLKIYARAKEEVVALDKLFPQQHYFLHSVQFAPRGVMPGALRGVGLVLEAAPSTPRDLPVQNKMIQEAVVQIASAVTTASQ